MSSSITGHHPTAYVVLGPHGVPLTVFLETDPPLRGMGTVVAIPFLAYLELREFPGLRLWTGTKVIERVFEKKLLPEPSEEDKAKFAVVD